MTYRATDVSVRIDGATLLDGVSIIWVIGLLLELFMMAWGVYNLTTLNREKL